MTYKLWLDDNRPAPDDTWVVATDFWSFKQTIEERGIPSHVSFDYVLLTPQDGHRFTGAHCAELLVQDMDYEKPEGFTYAVHSTYEGAKEKIDAVMKYLELPE